MYRSIVAFAFLQISLASTLVFAQTPAEPATPAVAAKQVDTSSSDQLQKLNETASKGINFLLEKGRDAADGSYSKQLSPAVTALCVSAMVRNGVPVANEKIQQSLTFLQTMVRPNGGIYAPKSNLRNYETSVSIIAFHQCNVDGKYDELLGKAASFLQGIQWDDGEGHGIESNRYGGQGYGGHERPDLSNTAFFLDALKELQGEDMQDSDSVRKAIVFTSRTQNLPSKYNTAEFTEHIPEGDLGSFVYSPEGTGETKPEPLSNTPRGGLRGYASMTYAGLKSFLYAGIDKDDIRVKAAMEWISRHYDLDSNPGLGKQGLYYYYHVFAKTMDAIGDPTFTDSEGVAHDWRSDLVEKLASQQRDDGSWTNEHDRWYEGDPNLVTAYSLLAISYCRPETAKTDSKPE